MAFIEGRGWIPPTPIKIYISNEDAKFARLNAERISRAKNYNLKSMYIGLLGEAAVAIWLRQSYGLKYRANFELFSKYSDGQVDMEVERWKIQIKTRLKGNPCRVRRLIGQNTIIPIKNADYFIFVELVSRDVKFGPQDVLLTGYIKTPALEEYQKLKTDIYKGEKISFWQIDPKYLEPMERMHHLWVHGV